MVADGSEMRLRLLSRDLDQLGLAHHVEPFVSAGLAGALLEVIDALADGSLRKPAMGTEEPLRLLFKSLGKIGLAHHVENFESAGLAGALLEIIDVMADESEMVDLPDAKTPPRSERKQRSRLPVSSPPPAFKDRLAMAAPSATARLPHPSSPIPSPLRPPSRSPAYTPRLPTGLARPPLGYRPLGYRVLSSSSQTQTRAAPAFSRADEGRSISVNTSGMVMCDGEHRDVEWRGAWRPAYVLGAIIHSVQPRFKGLVLLDDGRRFQNPASLSPATDAFAIM